VDGCEPHRGGPPTDKEGIRQTPRVDCRCVVRIAAGLQTGLEQRVTRKTRKLLPQITAEDARLNSFVDQIFPREPTLKVYRIDPDGKQTFLYATDLEFFSLDELRDHHDGGKFLLRTVRSNGTYGPSRVVYVAERYQR